MNNIYFGLVEIEGDMFCYTSYTADGNLTYNYNPEDLDRLDSLADLEIYQVEEGIYQLPSYLTKEEAINLIARQPGFYYSSEIEISI